MSAYTQLQIAMHTKKASFKDFNYRLTVVDYNASPATREVTEGCFDVAGMSQRHVLKTPDVEIYYEVFVQGQFAKKISCKAYPENSRQHSLYRFKATAESTRPEPNHLKEIVLDSNEVAWYLVKKPETMGALMNRIYQSPPGSDEWKVLAENNPHLGQVSTIKNLLPGQVVVLANSSKSTPKLQKYITQAREAETNRRRLHQQHTNFDAEFLAENYELFYDAMNPQEGNQAWLSGGNVPTLGEDSAATVDDSLKYGAIAKGGIDGALNFTKSANEAVMRAYGDITQAMAAEKRAGSRLANPKNFNEFRAKYPHLYANLDNALGRNLFQWDTGTKTSNLRRVIQRDAFVRGANYKGGLDAYARNLPTMGRVTQSMKLGGNLLVAYDAFESGRTIYNAAESGDFDKLHKAVAVEPLKLSGSVIGAAGGAAAGQYVGGIAATLILGVSTGGTALVVIGVCAVIAGLAGGAAIGWTGQVIGTGIYEVTKR